jgi:hypothetical protein
MTPLKNLTAEQLSARLLKESKLLMATARRCISRFDSDASGSAIEFAALSAIQSGELVEAAALSGQLGKEEALEMHRRLQTMLTAMSRLELAQENSGRA